MQLGKSNRHYDWIDGWSKSPDSESARTGWAHHDIVVSENGDVIAFHQADPIVLIFNSEGNHKASWDAPVSNAHGMSIVKENDEEFLWLADNTTGKVVKTTLDGQTVSKLQPPDLGVYHNNKYAPTDVTVNEESNGGNGDIWVTDGYGQNYIHRYDKYGNHIGSINGEEGDAGPFTCPHGIWIDTRKEVGELYVADRSNARVQVYDLNGNFNRAFGTGPGANWLHSPSGFATHGELMMVAELRGSRITVLDKNDELLGYLGENPGAFTMLDDWPNVTSEDVQSGRFNSPHGIATDSSGNIYVAEWMIGGRITKLEISN